MQDITPALISDIQKAFKSEFQKSSTIKRVYEKVRAGTATYSDANKFAIEVGNIRAKVLKNKISSAVLPDGKMYYNIAERIVNDSLGHNYRLVADVCENAQKNVNQSAGIGMKAVRPDFDADNAKSIIDKLASSDLFDDVAWILDEPVIHFTHSIVDDSIKKNADIQSEAGLEVTVTRVSEGNCCAWCDGLAGTYVYPSEVPEEVWQRHDRCRCTVTYGAKKLRAYTSGSGRTNTFRE